jgi:hypothetical protein
LIGQEKAPPGSGAWDAIVKSRKKNRRKRLKPARAKRRASEKFNERFKLKLLELPPLPRIDSSFFPTNAAIDSYVVSLRERLEAIDRTCREIWQIKGEAVTPEFVRGILEPRVITQIDVVEGETITRSSTTDLERWGPAWAYLAGEVGKLKSEFADRYAREIESRALARSIVEAEEQQKKPATQLTPVPAKAKAAKRGRPRSKDENRKMVREMHDAGKCWKDIRDMMNNKNGQEKTEEAYRALLRNR